MKKMLTLLALVSASAAFGAVKRSKQVPGFKNEEQEVIRSKTADRVFTTGAREKISLTIGDTTYEIETKPVFKIRAEEAA